MNTVLTFLTYLYSRLQLLYPDGFRNEFGEEMQVVFNHSMDEAVKDGYLALALVCLRELVNLPASLVRERWYEFQRKEMNMIRDGNVDSASGNDNGAGGWDALIGTLPFVLFGIASIIGKLRVPFLGIYADLAFYAIVLLGLLIGLIKGFPRWTYSYLGWALVFGWWWSSMGTYGLKIFGFQINYWSWQIWPPLLVTIGIALLWTRSLLPFRQLVRGIWQDWTLLSLAMYTFVGWMALIYDENHSPYLIVFMIASTLAISASVWIFMRSSQALHRFLALLSGFVAGIVIDRISMLTWDFAAYYGLHPAPSMPWYDSILDVILITGFWALILFWPAIIGLVRYMRNNWQKPRMPA